MILHLLFIAAPYESNTITYSEISLRHNVFIISFGYKEHKSKRINLSIRFLSSFPFSGVPEHPTPHDPLVHAVPSLSREFIC
jgi:hypothetical protein